MKRHLFQSQCGQTLIEIILAIGMIILVLVTLVAGITVGIRNNRFARDQIVAKDYVRQAEEWLRSQRDQLGWDGFHAIVTNRGGRVTATYCLPTLPATPTVFYGLGTGACSLTTYIPTVPTTYFVRSMVLTAVGANEIDATTTVSWVDGSKTHSSSSILQLTMY